MDQELKSLLKENLEISKDNNRILKKQWRMMKWGRFVKVFYWMIILGLTFGAYYFIQPVIEGVSQSLGGIGSGLENGLGFLQRIQETADSLPDLVNQIGN